LLLFEITKSMLTTSTLKSTADEHTFAADVCKEMKHFKTNYYGSSDTRKLKRRFDRYVVTKRAELKKLAMQQLAKIKTINDRTTNWASDSASFFTKGYNTTHDAKDESQARELFIEDFNASDVYNDLEEAQEHILFYRAISKLALHFEEQTKDAMEYMKNL